MRQLFLRRKLRLDMTDCLRDADLPRERRPSPPCSERPQTPLSFTFSLPSSATSFRRQPIRKTRQVLPNPVHDAQTDPGSGGVASGRVSPNIRLAVEPGCGGRAERRSGAGVRILAHDAAVVEGVDDDDSGETGVKTGSARASV
jgi:hypothetical protein